MSSNKKTKVDFREALKAKQPASKPKASMESVMVELKGYPTKVVRHDMPEDKWKEIKARELSTDDLEFFEETGSFRKPKVEKKRPGVLDKAFQWGNFPYPEPKAALEPDPQRTEHVERVASNTPSMRNPASFVPDMVTGAAPVETPVNPLVPNDLGGPVDIGAPAPDLSGTDADKLPPMSPPPLVGEETPPPPQKPLETSLGKLEVEPIPGQLPSEEEALTGLAEAKVEALRGAQAIAEKQAEAEKALRQQAIIDSAQDQVDEHERLAAYNSKMDEYERSQVDIRNQMLEHAKSAVDPNRYWANKDAGQRAAAVIAGALFGFTGQGMQWLQRLDGLVAQDIQAQAADLANRGQMLQSAAGQNKNLIAELRARGVEGAAAYHSAMGMMKESLANQIEIMKLNTSSESSRLVMDEKIAQVLADSAKDLEKGRQVQQAHAKDMELKTAQAQKLRAEAKSAGGPGGGAPLPIAAVNKVAAIDDSLGKLKELKAAFARIHGTDEKQGFWEGVGRVAKTKVPFAANAEKKYNAQVERAAGALAIARSATGTTSETDEDKALMDLAMAGDPIGLTKLNALITELEGMKTTGKEVAGKAGFSTTAYEGKQRELGQIPFTASK